MARLRLGRPARYADAITDAVGQPLFYGGGYSGPNVDSLSCESRLRAVLGLRILHLDLGDIQGTLRRHLVG
jgi:hypothetical protein